MISGLRAKLAIRSAFIILTVILAVGLAGISTSVVLTYSYQKRVLLDDLEGLLGIVENAAQIAVFLEDVDLAEDIAKGLVGDRIVQKVEIRASGKVLAEEVVFVSRNGYSAWLYEADRVTRPIISPFSSEIIGEIVVTSNPAALADNISEITRSILVLQVLELAGVFFVVLVVVMRLITRPITDIANSLHNLEISSGKKVRIPRGKHRQDEIGRLVVDINSMIDKVSALLQSEKELRHRIEFNEQKFRSIFENAASPICLFDSGGNIYSSNMAFSRLFSLPASAPGLAPVVNIYDLLGSQADELAVLASETIASGGTGELDILLDNGSNKWLKLIISPGEGGRSLQLIANEVTALKRAVSESEMKALVDPLTGIGNRQGVEKRLAELLNKPVASAATASSLFFIDLDYFKEVNDTYGHGAGDVVLKKVAGILQQLTRKNDYVARLGGDEFVVLINDVDEVLLSSRFADDLLDELSRPIEIAAQQKVNIGASIGITYCRPGDISPEEALKRADKAMYKAKERGRNQYCFDEDRSS